MAVAQVFDKVNDAKLSDKKNPEYVIDNGETDENGVNTFYACFESEPPRCNLIAAAKRDPFRKIQFFEDIQLQIANYIARIKNRVGTSSLNAYVSLRDCNYPSIILKPTFRGKNWIFLKQMAIMADGVVVIDRSFDHSDIDRGQTDRGIDESAQVVMSEQEVKSLRKVVEAKSVLIRLTGQKVYVGVEDEEKKEFIAGVKKLLRMHDALEQAVTKLGNVQDAACPV